MPSVRVTPLAPFCWVTDDFQDCIGWLDRRVDVEEVYCVPQVLEERLQIYLFKQFSELVKKQNEKVEIESNYDPKLKWKLKRFLDYGKEVLKQLSK